MTTILGVTATLLLLANILQAVAAISKKNAVHDAMMDLKLAEQERDEANDRAAAMVQERDNANQLRDRIEKAAKVVESDRDRLLAERKNLYYRNSKGQIAKLHP